MKRLIDHALHEWHHYSHRKPLLLRGARQVGKTYAVRELGKKFTHFVELNLESNQAAKRIIEQDLDVSRIVLQLSELVGKRIEPKTTLLFLDEVQVCPLAILLLRYLYEHLPQLHVIAAGSLLDFAIEQVGMPVGRVTSLYMHPVSFIEFACALGHTSWVRALLEHSPQNPISQPLHEKLTQLLAQYMAIGGMPEAINEWIRTQESRAVKIIHADLLFSYQQDFDKYAKKNQIKYLTLLFLKTMEQLGQKFIFAHVGEFQKRELAPALELLKKAGIVHTVTRSAGQGIPIGAQAHLDCFKILFLDIGLSQALLKFDIAKWFINPQETFINKGYMAEAFIGQEILAYSDPIMKEELFYWERDVRGSNAEVDYLIQMGDRVLPIEVKAGGSKRIVSMHIFLDSHLQSPYGVRFWLHNYAYEERVHSYPLYAVAQLFFNTHAHLRNACDYLIE